MILDQILFREEMMEMKDIFKSGINLLVEQVQERKAVRERSKNVCPDLLYAHGMALGIIREIYNSHIGVIGRTNKSISNKLVLIATFIQGIDLCEIAISEGLYVQASALLKQELETIAAINECTGDCRKNGRTPNVAFVGFGLNKEYGFLNGSGHVSDLTTFEELYKATLFETVEEKEPISLVPIFNKEQICYLYSMHIILILQVIDQLIELYKEMYDYIASEELKDAKKIVYKVLIENGYLEEEK